MNENKTYRKLLYGIFLIVVGVVLYSHTIYENDIWKSLYTGRYMAVEHQLPAHSQFTFSPTRSIRLRHAYTWFGNLLLWSVYTVSGLYGLQAFKIVVLGFTVWCLMSFVDGDDGLVLLPVTLIIGLILAGIEQKMLLRNAIFMIPITLALMKLWYQSIDRVSPRLMWLFPVLFFCWANIHASYLAGLGIYGLLVSGLVLDYLMARIDVPAGFVGRIVVILCISLATVVFVGPETDRQIVRFASSIVQSQGGISARLDYESTQSTVDTPSESTGQYSSNGTFNQVKQWLRSSVFKLDGFNSSEYAFPLDNTKHLFVRASLCLAILGLISVLFVSKKLRLSIVLPCVGAIIVGLGYLVTVALIPLVVGPIIIWTLVNSDVRWVTASSVARVCMNLSLVVMVVILSSCLVAGRMDSFTGSPYHRVGWGVHERFSQQLPNYVSGHLKKQKIFNGYSMGSWLVWNWWPKKKVFIDTKSSGYTNQFLQRYTSTSPTDIQQQFDLEWIILPLGNRFIGEYFIPSKEWQVIRLDRSLILFNQGNSAGCESTPMDCLLISHERWINLTAERQQTIQNTIWTIRSMANTGVTSGRLSR